MPPPVTLALPSMHRPIDNEDNKSPFSSRASRVLVPAAGHGLVLSSQGAGRRLDGGLLSVAEVAASIFQSEKWEGKFWYTTRQLRRQLVSFSRLGGHARSTRICELILLDISVTSSFPDFLHGFAE